VELIEWRSLQLGRRIGRGAEGCVYEARHQDAPVAIKESPGMNEIEMYLAAGVHDNLVGLRGLCHKVSQLLLARVRCLVHCSRITEQKRWSLFSYNLATTENILCASARRYCCWLHVK
jgi:hypothetical protein